MIAKKSYEELLDTVEAAMTLARVLGMYRTAHRLHDALNEGRAEMFEALPKNIPTVVFTIGPISQQ